MTAATITAAPTRARRRVLGYLGALAFLTYLDRACLAAIKPAVMDDLHLTMDQMSMVFSAFVLAYGVFEIPTGHWGDRIGRRRVLARIVAWWSTCTIATAGAFSYASLLVIRFLFGAGEAGAFPNATAAIARWFPVTEQGMAQGMLFASAHFGAAVTPLIVGGLLHVVSWRLLLVAFGAFGFIWVCAWWRWFRDDPAAHPDVDAAELALIAADRVAPAPAGTAGPRLLAVLANRSLLLLCLVYAANGYGFYFLITWLPDYLKGFHHFSPLELQLYAGLPLLLSVPADLFGGRLTDALARRYGLRMGRTLVGCIGYILAGAAVVGSTCCTSPVAAVVLFSIGAACSMATLGATWSTCTSIGGATTGTVGAVMNSASQIGAFCSPLVTTFIFKRYGDMTMQIYVIGALYVVAAVAWLFIDARAPALTPRTADPVARQD
ncbi:MAG: MFS transporter [Planctomycetes bacterium]|nr:MFS transporter [Planctomycetota bacterium]